MFSKAFRLRLTGLRARAVAKVFGPACDWAARGRGRRGRSMAVAIAVALHGLFLILAVGAAQGRATSMGQGDAVGDAEGVRVSLEGLAGAPAAFYRAKAKQPRRTPEIDALLRRLRPDNADETLPTTDKTPSRDAHDMLDLFDDGDPKSKRDAGDQHRDGDGGVGQNADKTNGRQAAADRRPDEADAGGSPLSNGDLWEQIQTCWRPDAGAVAVTLEVVLDGQGRIALPPKIIRPARAVLDEKRLTAETRAIQAVAQCAPFKGGGAFAGRRVYRFEFVAKRRSSG